MTLYDELIQAQQIPSAFTDWKDYREAVTQYLLDVLPKEANIAIFGAGLCNDIDIEKLLAHDLRITLIDKIPNLKQKLRDYYPKLDLERFEVIETDLVGITQEEYRAFGEFLLQMIRLDQEQTNIFELAKIACLHMKTIYENALKREIDISGKKFDYGIIFGLYSQLNNMIPWMWELILSELKQKEDSVFLLASEYTKHFIDKFHKVLLQSIDKEIIVGYEIQRLGTNSTVEGSKQAQKAFGELIQDNKIRLIDKNYIYWPFSIENGVVFDVEILRLELVHRFNT